MIICLSFIACEKEFVPEVIPSNEIVVEGFIEAGSNLPPYVILTKNLPFFKELKQSDLANSFVKNADITITSGSKSVKMTGICWSTLSPNDKKTVGLLIGINPDSVSASFDFCAYLDLSGTFTPKAGDRYDLTIKAEGKTLTATTTIPRLVPLDSSLFLQPPGNKGDTLAQLRAWINDPKGDDFYAYFTSINGSGYARGQNSVVDDKFFDGQNFKFNLFKSEPRDFKGSSESYGLFQIGDTMSIKWCTIDQDHFEFWNTLEFNANNQGPFSSYTRVKSNINGGIGIWGGMNVSFLDKVVKK
jgi:Domain of unknown function (DUF4249)